MSAPAGPAAVFRWIPDQVAVVGMLTATALAILLVTVFFSVLRRFSRQERSAVPASVMTPHSPAASTLPVIARQGRG